MEIHTKQTSLSWLALLTVLMLVSNSTSASISNLVVFGDSLSDNGNTRSEVPGGFLEPVATIAGYGSNGRFSNGPLWHEYLSANLGIAAATNSNDGGDNFAFGGARVDNDSGASTGVIRQTTQYLSRPSSVVADPNSLFINWSGGNDARDLVGNANPLALIDQQLDALFGTLGDLLDTGVTQLLVANLPDLGAIPENRGSSNQASATMISEAWNANLLARLFDLNDSTTADIYFFDVFSLFDAVLANPGASGFTNITGQCRSVFLGIFENECSDPSTYAFWDAIHPTTAAHAILGAEAFRLLDAKEVLKKQIVAASSPAVFVIFSIGLFALFYKKQSK